MMSNNNKIMGFRGEYRFLSNFYLSTIMVMGRIYPTAEHLYQAAKCMNAEEQEIIRVLPTPGLAKRYGRTVLMMENWDKQKERVMYEVVRAKFRQNRHLLDKLLATGDSLLIEENNWGDTYWGVCRGKGQNKLGEILMEVRNTENQETKVNFLNKITLT